MRLDIEQMWNLRKLISGEASLFCSTYLHYLFLNQILKYILDGRVKMHGCVDTHGVSIPRVEIVSY